MTKNFKITVAVVGMLLPLATQAFAAQSNLDAAKEKAAIISGNLVQDAKNLGPNLVESMQNDFGPVTGKSGARDGVIGTLEILADGYLIYKIPTADSKTIKAANKKIAVLRKQKSAEEIISEIESIKSNLNNFVVVNDANHDGAIQPNEQAIVQLKPDVAQRLNTLRNDRLVLEQANLSFQESSLRQTQEISEIKAEIVNIQDKVSNYENANVDANLDGQVSAEETKLGKLKDGPAAQVAELNARLGSTQAALEQAASTFVKNKEQIAKIGQELDSAVSNLANMNKAVLSQKAAGELSYLQLDLEKAPTNLEKSKQVVALEGTIKKLSLKGLRGLGIRVLRAAQVAGILVISGDVIARGTLLIALNKDASLSPGFYLAGKLCSEAVTCARAAELETQGAQWLVQNSQNILNSAKK
jgi:hypothetical protein